MELPIYVQSTGIDGTTECGRGSGAAPSGVGELPVVSRETAGSVMGRHSRSIDAEARLLCVGDDPDSVAALAAGVERHRPAATVESTTDPTVVPTLCSAWHADCVVVEPTLEPLDGDELRTAVRQRHPTVPVVSWTPTDDTSTAVLGARLDDALDQQPTTQPAGDVPPAGEHPLQQLVTAVNSDELLDRLKSLLKADPAVADTGFWLFESAADGLVPADGPANDRSLSTVAETAYQQREPRIATAQPGSERPTPVAFPLGRSGVVSARVDAGSLAVRARLGQLAAVAGAVLDSKREYAQLEQRFHRIAERNRELSQFARTVSHDLNSPLSVIYGRIELSLAEPSKADVHLQAAQNAAERVDSLITDHLQSVETTDDEGTERVSIQTVAIQAWRIVDPSMARLQIEPQLDKVEANAIRLQQLFENLIRNAIEHGSEESVGLGSHAETDPHAVFDDETESVTVTIKPTPTGFAVCDDGPGIPADERSAVFESGYTTTDSGSGLGLHIVAEIVRSHDWEISVGESGSGGARFEVDTQ